MATSIASWATCASSQAALAALESQVEAEAVARETLALARRSAQDWKNLLLRGSDPSQRQIFQTRFDTNARDYGEHLDTLRARLESLRSQTEPMQTLDRERGVMFDRYRSALSRHGVDTLASSSAADRDVQGADVTTFRTLEKMIDSLAARRAVMFRELQAELRRCIP